MNENNIPQTLREIAGLNSQPAKLSESVLVIIDAQKEYTDGRLPLPGIEKSLLEGKRVLEKARKVGTPIIHIVQHGRPGGPICDPTGPFVEICEPVEPIPGETVIIKNFPSSFAGTTLNEELTKLGRKNLIVIGYMTHMCVSTTVRAALDYGYQVTVVAKATGSRDLPDGCGGVIPAEMVHKANLAALADRFAVVVQSADDLGS